MKALHLTLIGLLTALALPAALVRADAAADPETVVRQMVEARGSAYAGACAETRSPQDIGKVCATLAGERREQRAYLAGRTFSEYGVWLFVERTGEGWSEAGSAPLDFFATEVAIPWPDEE